MIRSGMPRCTRSPIRSGSVCACATADIPSSPTKSGFSCAARTIIFVDADLRLMLDGGGRFLLRWEECLSNRKALDEHCWRKRRADSDPHNPAQWQGNKAGPRVLKGRSDMPGIVQYQFRREVAAWQAGRWLSQQCSDEEKISAGNTPSMLRAAPARWT